MARSFLGKWFGTSPEEEEHEPDGVAVASGSPEGATGFGSDDVAASRLGFKSMFSRKTNKKGPGTIRKEGTETIVRGAMHPPHGHPLSIEEQRRLEAAPSGVIVGVEAGELGESGLGYEGGEAGSEASTPLGSSPGRHIDPFGAVKPIEKQARSSHMTSEDESPECSLVDKKVSSGLADSLLPAAGWESKVSKFQKLMAQPSVDLGQLRALAWGGIPSSFRPTVWQLLLIYLPINSDRRHSTLERKRREYLDCVPQYFENGGCERTEMEQNIYRQIQLDCPRTCPSITMFQDKIAHEALLRILYIWAIRHPGSGYVQGINDLATPFLVVFLSTFVDDINACNLAELPPGVMQVVEADTYWCLTKLLDGIQDHYTFAQPGIQRMVYDLKNLIRRINQPLHDHLETQGLQFIQFAFRWMNCLLMRELPLVHIVRLWDTYLAMEDGFSKFHVYVCAAFLEHWSAELVELDFQELVIKLQHLPTEHWGAHEVDTLLSKAYVLQHQFEGAGSHLRSE